MDPTVRQERFGPPPTTTGGNIESAERTDQGKVRRINEDACLDRPDVMLWAVADGVGGWHAGDRASKLVIERLRSVGGEGGVAMLNAVRAQLEGANAQLLEEAEQSGRPSATTVVVLMFAGRHYACLWAGDSRLYLWRGGTLQQLTRDHTEAQALADAGLMTLEEAERQTNKNSIARAVGAAEKLDLDMVQAGYEDGDIFLLCTDGLTKMLNDDEIATGVGRLVPRTIVDTLVEQSLERGAIDNVTVVAVRCLPSAG